MKVVLLAGGLGTRLSEETGLRPKPMVEIGGVPILVHIMKIYAHYNIKEFVVCLGYKGYFIKEYFKNFQLHSSDVTFNLSDGAIEIHASRAPDWKVTLIDTGQDTQTGGRLARVKPYLNNETFMLTYGDGVANINIDELLKTHKKHKRLATMTAVQPPGRFGALSFDEKDPSQINTFQEKPLGDGGWINGGFMVFEPEAIDYIKDGDPTILEQAPLKNLASDGQLTVYHHHNFWWAMDTLRDKRYLDDLAKKGSAPWEQLS